MSDFRDCDDADSARCITQNFNKSHYLSEFLNLFQRTCMTCFLQSLFFCEQVTRTLTSAINRFEMPDPKREEPKPLQTSVGWVGRVGLVGWVLESARAWENESTISLVVTYFTHFVHIGNCHAHSRSGLSQTRSSGEWCVALRKAVRFLTVSCIHSWIQLGFSKYA